MTDERAIEPEFAAFLEVVRKQPDFDPFSMPPAETAARLRAPLLKKPAPVHPSVDIHDEVVERDGLSVPVRVYKQKSCAQGPVVLNMHGGGFVVGSVSMDDFRCAEIVAALGGTVVSVDYRLAPENPYPAAIDDCYAVLGWAQHLAGSDPAGKLATMGSSAGGSLAIAMAMASRDRGGPRISAQVLLYPMADDRLHQRSYVTYGAGYYLTARDLRWYYEQYRGAGCNQYLAPLRSSSLAGLPPSLIVTAEFDPLRDEAEELASRLQAEGNWAVLTRYGGTVHGFASIASGARASRLCLQQAIEFFRATLA